MKRILLAFIRWRERRAWAACKRWQRASWHLHGVEPQQRADYYLRPGWRG
jgi:hypothetical protein